MTGVRYEMTDPEKPIDGFSVTRTAAGAPGDHLRRTYSEVV